MRLLEAHLCASGVITHTFPISTWSYTFFSPQTPVPGPTFRNTASASVFSLRAPWALCCSFSSLCPLPPGCLCPIPGTCPTDTLHFSPQHRQLWSDGAPFPPTPDGESVPHREAWPYFFSPPKYCSMNHEHSRSQIYGVEEWDGEGLGHTICSTLLGCSPPTSNLLTSAC